MVRKCAKASEPFHHPKPQGLHHSIKLTIKTMILETKENGILKMFNTHTKAVREEILITRRINLKGPVTRLGNIVNLGYNETIECGTNESAVLLLTDIATILNQ